MRVTAKDGRAIIRGDIHAIALPRHNDTRPYRAGDRTPLQYPQTLTDSYDQPIRTPDNQPRLTFQTQIVLHISVTRSATVGGIELHTAKALGHPTIDAFRDAWDQSHSFGPSRKTGRTIRKHKLRLRTPIWVIYFTPEHQERIHLLSRTGDAYTSSTVVALEDEPEAIDPILVAALPASREARRRWQLARESISADYESLPLIDKIAHLQRLAQAEHVDISGPLKEMERQARRAWQRFPPRAA